jgi:hypothetical protein
LLGKWSGAGSVASVGACRLVRFPQTVTLDALRLKITSSAAPNLDEVALFRNQDLAS